MLVKRCQSGFATGREMKRWQQAIGRANAKGWCPFALTPPQAHRRSSAMSFLRVLVALEAFVGA
jgi:hypothetical protein